MKILNYIKKNPVKSAGIGLAALLIFNRVKGSSNKDTSNIIDDELEESQLQLSYPLSNYNIMADQLQSAMFDAGTDEQTIYTIFKKLKNPKDLLQLVKAFGRRTYYVFGYPQGNYNLGQWIQEELSDSEKQEINSILQSNNINYTF